MIDRKTLSARQALTGQTIQELAELITKATGEKVREFDIHNRFRTDTAENRRAKMISDMSDRLTFSQIEDIRAKETNLVRDILKAKGVEVKDLEVQLLHRAWGKRDVVFVNGSFYGIYDAEANAWTHREG